MDININLLPAEIRPRPLIDRRKMMLLVLVVALGCGCYYLYDLKAGSEEDAAVVEARIEAIESQASSVAANLEAKEIIAAITGAKKTWADLEAATHDYQVFVDSRLEWGDVVDRVSKRVVGGVTLESIVQSKSGEVEVGGAASSYDRAAAYATALEADEAFGSVRTSEWYADKGEFLLTVVVAQGGDR